MPAARHRYYVGFRRDMRDIPTIAGFNTREEVLEHCRRYLGASYFSLDIHLTETAQRLSFAQFHRLAKTGSIFGPLIPQPDGSIL